MATKGSFRTSAYDSRCLEFAWSRKSYSIPNNTTTISWTLTARGKGQYSQYNAGNFLVVIDGVQKYFSSTRITTTDGLLIASGEHTFTHLTDGTKSFTAYVEAGIYTYAVNCSGSDIFTLDSIPRAATITSANNITDEQNPSFTFSNPGGFNLVAELEINPINTHLFTRTVPNTGSYTFQLTEAERNTLRSYIPAETATLRYLLYSNNDQFVSYIDKTISLVNYEPTASIVIRDNNPDTTALTGNPDVFVKGQSTASFTITGTARKGATITKYMCMGQEVRANDAILNVPTNIITYGVEDSRGITYSNSITKGFVDYIDVSCRQKVSIELDGETGAIINVSLDGNYFNGSFGNVANELRLEVRYSEVDGEWSNWIPLTEAYTPTYNGKTYSLTAPIPYEFDYSKAYVIESRASDKLTTDYSGDYTAKLSPVFDWSDYNFNFNVPVSFKDKFMRNFVEEQGEMDGWKFRIWDDGTMECWRRLQLNGVNVNSAWGGLYTSGSLSATNLTYPFEFVETPILTVSLMPFGAGGIIMTPGNGYGNHTQTGPFEIARGTAMTNTQYLLSYHAVGKIS